MNGAAHPPNGTSEVGLDQVDEDDELLVMEEPNSPNVEEVFDRTKSLSVRERTYKAPPSSFSIPKQSMSDNGVNMAADFFSPEVFRIVLHNPTTAHRLLRFSQARMCGENMEFLEKVSDRIYLPGPQVFETRQSLIRHRPPNLTTTNDRLPFSIPSPGCKTNLLPRSTGSMPSSMR